MANRELDSALMKAALQALRDAGGSLPAREVRAQVEKRVQLTEDYVRPGNKAGFIRKQEGRWYLTPEGLAASELPAVQIFDRARQGFSEWRAFRGQQDGTREQSATDETTAESGEPLQRSFVFERAESEARAEIEEYVRAKTPYEFQDFVAALLRGMGYATPFVAPTGPDGGTDILAYPDPVGAQTPHIRVQVKHRPSQKATRDEIAALRGIMRQGREIGLFVSTSGFTSDAIREARQGSPHVELADLPRLLQHWMTFYERLSEPDTAHLPLRK